jgi:hypothetical protein
MKFFRCGPPSFKERVAIKKYNEVIAMINSLFFTTDEWCRALLYITFNALQ